MKGIVVEKKKNEVFVMMADGTFRAARDQGYFIGEELEMEPEKKKSNKNIFVRWGAGVAAAVMLFAAGAFVYGMPVGYVSLDVNPSIEYSINILNRVIEVKSLNEDGAKILATLDLKDLTIEDAVEQTTAKLIEEGYITGDENAGVVIATFEEDEDKAIALAARIQESLQAFMTEEGETAEVVSEAVGRQRVQEAEQLGVTAGKLNLVQKMLTMAGEEADPAKVEEWLTKSVKEINKQTKELRKAQKLDTDVTDDDLEDNDEPDENVLGDGDLIDGEEELQADDLDDSDTNKAAGKVKEEKDFGKAAVTVVETEKKENPQKDDTKKASEVTKTEEEPESDDADESDEDSSSSDQNAPKDNGSTKGNSGKSKDKNDD